MNKKLYGDNGYLDFRYIFKMSEKHCCPYILIVGGRGTGKTYGALKYLTTENIKFMFMRRTQTQLDLIRKPEFSPFKSINRDLNKTIEFFSISKYNSALYDSEINEKGKLVPVGEPYGIAAALSTFSNLRGFDASDLDIVLYDEFICERHERPLKEEASALFNALETIGRNRELNGQKPLKLLALANANNISNPIFVSLGLVTQAEKMTRSGQEIYFNNAKGVMLIMLNDSPISSKKMQTALYNLTGGTEYAEMALHNNFVGVARDCIESQDLRQYKLFTIVGELAIYKHKSVRKFYVTTHISGECKETFTTSINSLRAFRIKYGDIWGLYCIGLVKFETYSLQVLFEKYYKE